MKIYSTRFFILVIFSFIVSCNNNNFLSSKYDYPIDSIKGTTVFKWNNFHGDSLFTTFTHHTLDFTEKDTLLIKYSYNDNNLTDSAIFLIRNNKNKLLQKWVFFEDDNGELITLKSKRIVRKDNFERIVYNSFLLPFLLNAEDRTISNYDTLDTGQLAIMSDYELSLRIKLLNIRVFNMTAEILTILEKNIGPVEFKTIMDDKPFHAFLDTIYHRY